MLSFISRRGVCVDVDKRRGGGGFKPVSSDFLSDSLLRSVFAAASLFVCWKAEGVLGFALFLSSMATPAT